MGGANADLGTTLQTPDRGSDFAVSAVCRLTRAWTHLVVLARTNVRCTVLLLLSPFLLPKREGDDRDSV